MTICPPPKWPKTLGLIIYIFFLQVSLNTFQTGRQKQTRLARNLSMSLQQNLFILHSLRKCLTSPFIYDCGNMNVRGHSMFKPRQLQHLKEQTETTLLWLQFMFGHRNCTVIYKNQLHLDQVSSNYSNHNTKGFS